MWITINYGKFFKRWEYHTTLPASWEIYMQVKKQQLDLDMEQWTGSKLGKDYVRALYRHPAYLTYIRSTSCKMLGWLKHKVESRLPGEISITSYMQMTPPYGRKWRGSKEPPDEKRDKSEKSGLKLNIQKWRSWHLVPSLHIKFMGKQWKQWEILFSWAPKSLQMVTAAMKLKDTYFLEEKLWLTQTVYWKAETLFYWQRSVQSKLCFFHSIGSHVWIWEMDHKDSWALKNWCFWTVVLGKNLESHLPCKQIKLVHPKGNQSWIFIGRTDTEADGKNWLSGNVHDAGKD